MRTSSHFKLITGLSLFVVFALGLTSLWFLHGVTHAAHPAFQLPMKSASTSARRQKAWHVVSSPNLGSGPNLLNAIAVISTNDAWAVGCSSCIPLANPSQTLIEHWNGTQWSIIPSLNPNAGSVNILEGVVALSTSDVWAVGFSGGSPLVTPYVPAQTLIEHWNGIQWSIIHSPNSFGDSRLYGLTAVTANDIWAVGEYDSLSIPNQTLIEHWNGIQWSIIPSPNGDYFNILQGVTALSASDIWAVGYSWSDGGGCPCTAMIEHWNGTSWSVVPSPIIGSFLGGVVALSANNVWAMGDFIYHWNGTSWSVDPYLVPGVLNGVVALSASDIWAVGSTKAHWKGTHWSTVSSPNVRSKSSALNGIGRVPGAASLWAVGYYTNSSGVAQTLTEFYG